MRRWAPHPPLWAWLLAESVADGDGGFYLGWISIEEIWLVGPLTDGIKRGRAEHGIGRRDDLKLFDLSVLTNDCVENNLAVQLCTLGRVRIHRLYKFVAIACHVASADLDRGHGVGLSVGLDAGVEVGLVGFDHYVRDDFDDRVRIGCVGHVDFDGGSGLTDGWAWEVEGDLGWGGAGWGWADLDVGRPDVGWGKIELDYFGWADAGWGRIELDCGWAEVGWGEIELDCRWRGGGLLCDYLLAEGEGGGAGAADECDAEGGGDEARCSSQLDGSLGQVHNSPLEIFEGVGIEDSDGVSGGGCVGACGELGGET